MTKEEKKNIASVLKMQKTLIDNIYNACAENAKIFEVNYVPVAYVKMMGGIATESISNSIKNDSKKIPDGPEKDTMTKVLELNDTMIDSINKACKLKAEEFHVDYVPIKLLRGICDLAWENIETGLKKGFGN